MTKAVMLNAIADTKDGPTEEFEQHHETTRRKTKSGAGGKRTVWKHEALFVRDKITPAEWDGAARWVNDYLVGIIGRSSRSCLDMSVRGGGEGGGEEHRMAAGSRYMAAAAWLNNEPDVRKEFGQYPPSEFMVQALVNDRTYSWLGRELGEEREWASRVLLKCIQRIALHYAAADKASGHDSTPATREAVLKLLDPDDEEGEE